MRKQTLLVVDDERSAREGLVRLFKRDYHVVAAESGATALALLDSHEVDLMLCDVRMPGMDGLTLMERAHEQQPELVVVVMTAYGDVELAVEAMQRGARDFMTKPLQLEKLEVGVRGLLKARDLERENASLRAQLDVRFGMENMIGQSAPMQEVFETIRQVAQSRATVLIQGESGTGKELVAKAIHQLSSRKEGPFVPVHCAALAENLLESELFGHEKGAFTGAMERRIGRFEKATGGSLFLDEISEINASVQVKILRALEERQIERVGSDLGVDVDTRLIAATNRDLQEMVIQGDFREDLFYRLYVVVITLPPLRERGDDVLLLLNHYLAQFCEENGKSIRGFTPEAYALLAGYGWPGNIRELRNLVERMVVLARGEWLDVMDLPPQVRQQGGEPGGALKPGEGMTVEQMEQEMILQALERTGGNRTLAAEQLGMSRRTLHRKLNKLGLTRQVVDVRVEEDEQNG
ncbi:MAG: sigma-54-dependent Fis family transcriptional regulator [Kiritimatiellaceae bacterium]|nr:MAG: sigma-54-dependent Fis family transcriptional regulator [Kiritimatiellaceae bacterium]|tara:strand:- start:340 stop:1737 length:1398 start_codon:yes stop_codon:yes gene_type:complete